MKASWHTEVIVDGYVLRESAFHEGQWDVLNHKSETYGWVRPDPYFDPDVWLYQHLGDTSVEYAFSHNEAARKIVGAARDAAEAVLSGAFFNEQGGAG